MIIDSDWLKLIFYRKSRKQFNFFFRPIAALLSVATLFVFQIRMRNSGKFRSARKIPSSGKQPLDYMKTNHFKMLLNVLSTTYTYIV